MNRLGILDILLRVLSGVGVSIVKNVVERERIFREMRAPCIYREIKKR